MTYSPIDDVVDLQLIITDKTIERLKLLRSSDLFTNLPGSIPGEKAWLIKKFICVLDVLITDLKINPSKRWVMEMFVPSLEAMQAEDTEAREHFGDHLELIMDILEIESSDGLLGAYL